MGLSNGSYGHEGGASIKGNVNDIANVYDVKDIIKQVIFTPNVFIVQL